MRLKLSQEEWEKFRPSQSEVEAGAHELFRIGKFHNWFNGGNISRYDEMDPLGKEEFEDVVAIILIAAAHARSATKEG
ncbi:MULTISPECIES: hypothetical protein [Inquilinus]|uniref:Uncharacterized protein n=1 Tax=Inquilinus ginsengisoli TaxID=363840 RepID=A0ABU1JQT0_9PROT|nr:hypothetical protein [Inquilinus ginsengisoli]MDR6290979.1 hypothetical protein [Inquilinus ginsengisoli]